MSTRHKENTVKLQLDFKYLRTQNTLKKGKKTHRYELEENLFEEQVESDAEDGLSSIVESVTNRLQEDYDELIGDDTDKKRFIKSLTRVFALLLNTKVNTVDKIKKILRIAVETTLKIWQGPK